MLDPAVVAVARALWVHGEVLLGAGIALVLVAVLIGVGPKHTRARAAAAALLVMGLLQALAGGVVQWYRPAIESADLPAPSERSILAVRALFERVQAGALVLAALATAVFVVCVLRRRSRTLARRGAAFGFGFGAIALAVQALAAEGSVRAGLHHLDHERAFLGVGARVAAYFAQRSPLRFQGVTPRELEATVLRGGSDDLSVVRVRLRLLDRTDSFPQHCLASPSEIWCLFSGKKAALEKLVRQPSFQRAAADMSDDELVDWVAFALGVDVWRPATALSYTRRYGRPPSVKRGFGRTRIDFWERHPWTPGFTVQLRRTVVTLQGADVGVAHGLMTAPLRPEHEPPAPLLPP